MSHVDGRSAAMRSARVPPTGRPFPFWVLQLGEMIAAVVLVEVSVHVSGGATLIVAALAFALLAAAAQGPLGLVRICPQRVHVALVLTAAGLAAAAPAVPALRPDIEGIIVLEFAAVGLIRLATLTRTSEQSRDGSRNRRRAATVIDTTASVVDPTTAPSPPPAPAPTGTTAGAATESAARRAGRAAGAATASGKRLAATHRPAAEARVKRSIRHAGRWAGRFTSPPSDHRPPEA